MKITEEGLALIREAEGFRGTAYGDATGIWTIGFGHTAMAGAPVVTTGLQITRDEAEKILARDVEQFSRGVTRELVQPVNDDQFSALVSFAYNVGLENFRKSSVLKAVNTQDFDAVPRRLQLWVKAGGKVLPGLINRRAAEATLFMKHEGPVQGPVTPVGGKPAHQSTTIWAASLLAIFSMANELARLLGYGVLGLLFAAGGVAAALWIIRERRKKSQQEGI